MATSLAFTSQAHAEGEWRFGAGSGLLALNIEGDVGFHTAQGPVKMELDIDAEDVADVLESAIGISGFASRDEWRITYLYQNMELGGNVRGTVLNGPSLAASASLEVTIAELAVSYRFAQVGKHAWSGLVGARYLEHDYDANLKAGPVSFSRDLNEDWTDMLVGLTHAHTFSPKLAWTSRADYGFGGSEGTFLVNTGLTWKINDRFTTKFFAQLTAIDFENGDPGDADWYLYDNDEFGLGINLFVTW